MCLYWVKFEFFQILTISVNLSIKKELLVIIKILLILIFYAFMVLTLIWNLTKWAIIISTKVLTLELVHSWSLCESNEITSMVLGGVVKTENWCELVKFENLGTAMDRMLVHPPYSHVEILTTKTRAFGVGVLER